MEWIQEPSGICKGFCYIWYLFGLDLHPSIHSFISSILTLVHVYFTHGWLVISLQARLYQPACSCGDHHVRSDADVMLCLSFPSCYCDEMSPRHQGEGTEQGKGLTPNLTVCVWNILVSYSLLFVYKQGSNGGFQRSERFMEPIYGTSARPGQSIYYTAQEATGLIWIVTSVSSHRGEYSINIINLLHPPALKKLPAT